MTERHLLFAVLAFESELLDLPQLTAACRAWAADKSKPIADLLVERGWITTEDRGFIEKQLDRKLAKHQHDPRVTLNAVTRGDVCDAIKEIDDPDIQQSLSSWPSSGPLLIETFGETLADDPALVPQSRYTWVSEVGKGGLGKVWLARDNDLSREVALKELKPGSASSEAVRRLIKEAQITGQLQHPNIVPVYEVNRGGRPFYTMKLVKGETLLQAIHRHHQQRREGKTDLLLEQRLMSVFLNVCDAIAYAHSRGVIHRDLKPDNIVLGDYGEAIVLDWGLARRINAPDELAAPVELTDDARTDVTQAGQKLGTPAYMSPEQASGRVDLMDTRTDIYCLGAILFQILTGVPPHRVVADAFSIGSDAGRVGHEKPSSLAALLHRIATGETPNVRELDHSIPEELDAICAKAMCKWREERYQSAQDLKSALLEFQVHKESIELAAIAARQLDQAKQSERYQDYNSALFRFEEALRQWPENSAAKLGIQETLLAHGQTAIKHGDVNPRMSLLTTNDDVLAEVQTKLADALEELTTRTRYLLTTRTRYLKWLKVSAGALVCAFMVMLFAAARFQLDFRIAKRRADEAIEAVRNSKVDLQRAEAIRLATENQKNEAIRLAAEAIQIKEVAEHQTAKAEQDRMIVLKEAAKAKDEIEIIRKSQSMAEAARRAAQIAALAAAKELANAKEKSNYLLGLVEAQRCVLEDRNPDALKKLMQLKQEYPDRVNGEWERLWKKVAPPPEASATK
jgi:serine/threonine protein kinase